MCLLLSCVYRPSIITCHFSSTAPTGPPTDVSTVTNGSSITVRWSPVPCLQRNSQITGYVVRYTEVTSSRTTSADTNVTGGSSTSITINGLQGSTHYSIEVAAVGAGETGVFSSPITANASKSKYYSLQSDGGGGGGLPGAVTAWLHYACHMLCSR